MSSARIPWWIWLIAASSVVCFLAGFVYLPLKLPEATGVNLSFRDNRVASVTPGSPGDTAGFKQGDRIVNIDGRVVQNIFEVGSALGNTRFDHPVSIVVLRGRQEVPLQLTLNHKLTQRWGSKESLGWWVEVAVSLIQLLVGLLVLFKRPRDLTAVAAGIFLCSIGTSSGNFMSPNAAVVWRTLPLAIQWLIFPMVVVGSNGTPVPTLLFALSFPKPLLYRRWAWMMLAVLTAPLLCFVAAANYIVLFAPQRAVDVFPGWLVAIIGIDFLLVFLGSVVILAVNYFRLREVNERRRIRLVVFGLLLFLVDFLAFLLFSSFQKTLWLSAIAISPLVFGLAQVPFTICVAYAVLKQRLFQVSFIVRQGLQYALAKNGIRTLQMLAILVVTLTALALIGQNRDRPQKIIVIAVGLLALFTIRRMTEKIGAWTDRRFFREAYDAEQALSELSDGVRGIVEAHSLIETVAERISETLHISRVAVLLGGAGPYRPAYALGYGAAPDIAFSPSAGTVKVLQRQKEPARVYFDDPQSWLYREPEVTEEDRAKLTELDTELLLPLSARDELLGFISLGPKRSAEPYSRTDLRLLKSVATQTGLALENARLISAIAAEVAQRERLNSEMQIARKVQERLFPQTLPPIAGIDYAGACRSALGVGGDYYDFLALPAGKLGIAIGDVSGKGIAAALTMASLQASLRSEATRAPDNLSLMMSNVNRLLYEASASNTYATFFYGQYDPASRQLTYVNAGHNPPMLFHCSNGEWPLTRLETGGTVVGLLENSSYRQAALTIAPGDMLIAFTDGISEAMNDAQDEFGEERLIETINCCAGLSPTEIIAGIMRTADAFVAGVKQNDDMTLVVLCAQPEAVK
ncbi:MAG: SpoIIE family protein phosphatase [Acidobacteriota bacterium]|nr:SpoIIE family protein phosphatase [Acidobacteriota bacterium]